LRTDTAQLWRVAILFLLLYAFALIRLFNGDILLGALSLGASFVACALFDHLVTHWIEQGDKEHGQ